MTRDLARTPIYHITHFGNLPRILASGGLWSDSGLLAKGGAQVRIGMNKLKDTRMYVNRVACAGNRFVGDFVPFYYCPRSPMLYLINKGGTGLAPGSQGDIVHLVSNVQAALDQQRRWAISDGNAASGYANFFDDVAALDRELDWNAIRTNSWKQCKTAKAAEFLLSDQFDWDAVTHIGCHSQTTASRVATLIHDAAHRPQVLVRSHWYFP